MRRHPDFVLRADFTGDAAAYPELVAALSRPLLVSPLSPYDLRTAVEQPALAHGVTFEDDGDAQCLADLQEAARATGESYVEAWGGWIRVR